MSTKKPQEKKTSEILQGFLDYLDDCRSECKQAQANVATEDAKRQDFIHAIEFENSCKERSKIATQEHLSRKRRRVAKDKVLELEKVVAFANSEKNKPFLKALRGLIKEQRRVEEYLSSERIYKPRGGAIDGNSDRQPGKSPGDQEN